MMKTISIILALLLCGMACRQQKVNNDNNNSMDNEKQTATTQAVMEQNEEFLRNLSPEELNALYDVPVTTMRIYRNDGGESEDLVMGKGSLLHLATFYNLPIAAGTLIEKGANMEVKDSEGNSPLEAAVIAYSTNTESVQKVLIENKANMNFYTRRDVPLLYQYIWYERFELAELAIMNGADVNMKTKDGDSILEFAERRGTPKIVSMLKAKGAKK